jgi:hypothetical protein
MTCSNPIDAAILADYWLGGLADAEERGVEEHLFACDACGARLREVIVLAEGVRGLAREGSLMMVVSDAFLQRAAEAGLRVREYAPPPGGSIECTVTAEDDLLIGRLRANFAGARRVDLCICDAQGAEQHRLTDIPFHSQTESVAFQQPITYAKAAPSETMIARLVAFDDAGDDAGSERLLGEYTFNHTRTLPGPGAW